MFLGKELETYEFTLLEEIRQDSSKISIIF